MKLARFALTFAIFALLLQLWWLTERAAAFMGFGAAPRMAIVSFVALPAATGPAPLTTGYDVCVDSLDGRPLEELTFVVTCANGSKVISQVGTSGDPVDADTTCYHFNTPTCVDAADGTAEVRLLWRGRDVKQGASLGINVTEASVPVVMLADAWPNPAAAPASDLEAGLLAPGGVAPVHAFADLDYDCAPTATQTDPCFETDWGVLPANGLFSPITNIPDQTPGEKTLRFAVRDANDAGATDAIRFTVTGVTLECDLTLANATGPSPLNNVRPTLACTGGATASPCDLRFCATSACTTAAETVIYSNTFDSAGCALATATDPPFACPIDPSPDGPGGDTTAAQVGQTAGGTQFMRFDNAFPNSAASLKIDVGWRFTTEGTFTQNRLITLRNGGTEANIYVNRGSASTNTLCLNAGGGSCCVANAYVENDWNSRFTIDVISTATGQTRLLDEAGVPLCTANPINPGPFPVDGFSLNPSNNVVEYAYLNVIVPTPGAGVVTVDDNTTWPYDLFAQTGTDFDGYTADTNVLASATCPGVETQSVQAAVDVDVTVPFMVTSVTSTAGTSCTKPDCTIDDLAASFTGGTGSVTDVSVRVGAGTTPIPVAGTFTSSPIQLIGPEGLDPIVLETAGTVEITVFMTSGAVTQSNKLLFQVSDPPAGNDQLVCAPSDSTETASPGASPPDDSIAVNATDGSAIDFTCIENEPTMFLETCCGTTPETIARSFNTTTLPPGTQRPAPIKCCEDGDASNCATCTPVIQITNPTGADPPYIVDRVGGKPRSYASYGYPNPVVASVTPELHTFDFEIRDGDQSNLMTLNGTFNNDYTKSILIHEKTVDRMGFRPEGTVCSPASTCGDSQNGCGTRDAANFPWPGPPSNTNVLRSKVLWVKRSVFRRAWQTCPNNPSYPHSDGIQGWAAFHCPYEHALFQSGGAYDVDSSQAMLFTEHVSGEHENPAHPCRFKTWTLQDWTLGPNGQVYADSCDIRSQTPGSGGFNCHGSNNLLPASVLGDRGNWIIWIVGGSGTGRCTGCEVIMVATDPNRITLVNGGTKRTYTTLEAALSAEFALGKFIPGFLGYSAAGWATPPAKATPANTRTDPN